MVRVYVRGWTQREMDLASMLLEFKNRLLDCEVRDDS